MEGAVVGAIEGAAFSRRLMKLCFLPTDATQLFGRWGDEATSPASIEIKKLSRWNVSLMIWSYVDLPVWRCEKVQINGRTKHVWYPGRPEMVYVGNWNSVYYYKI